MHTEAISRKRATARFLASKDGKNGKGNEPPGLSPEEEEEEQELLRLLRGDVPEEEES